MSKHGRFQITQKLFLRKGDLLLVLRDKKSGFGDLPGGRMDEDEFFGDWLDSLRREMREEMGDSLHYEVNPEPILVHKHRVTDGNHPCIIIGYSGKYLGGEIGLSEEHDFLDWVNIQDFQPESFFSDYMLEAVEKYLKQYA
jgi:8-oxo-dGTP pyrophosphatase MutT (NUDIX family)